MMNGGKVLVNTSFVGAGSSVGDVITWAGAQGALVVHGTIFPTVFNLCLVGVGNTSGSSAATELRTVKVNSGSISSTGVYPMMLPAGSYQIQASGTSSIGVYAALMPCF